MISLSMVVLLSIASLCFAGPYEDLKIHAQEVPRAEIDAVIPQLIANETNESTVGMKSHYTLALFENVASGTTWYILDGYYQLKSGKILFLDFNYDPQDKYWKPIENYKYYMPSRGLRFMLEADELCNPYKRHFIGVVSTYAEPAQLNQLQSFFEQTYQRQPIFMVDNGNVLIIDPTKSARKSSDVMFALQENDLNKKIAASTGLTSSIVPSGREPSTPELKKTYVGSSGECLK